jgi:hypothetical protein
MRELYPASSRKDEFKSVVMKDPAGGDGNERPPAMSAAERSVARGLGDLGCGTRSKDLLQEMLDRASDLRLCGVEAHGCRCP